MRKEIESIHSWHIFQTIFHFISMETVFKTLYLIFHNTEWHIEPGGDWNKECQKYHRNYCSDRIGFGVEKKNISSLFY